MKGKSKIGRYALLMCGILVLILTISVCGLSEASDRVSLSASQTISSADRTGSSTNAPYEKSRADAHLQAVGVMLAILTGITKFLR